MKVEEYERPEEPEVYLKDPEVYEEEETYGDVIETEPLSKEEYVLKVTPSSNTEAVIIDTGSTKFADVSDDNKVYFSDFYHDTRTFLSKANSTKFIIVVYLLLLFPFLLYLGLISDTTYRELVLILTLPYLGLDVLEKKTLLKR